LKKAVLRKVVLLNLVGVSGGVVQRVCKVREGVKMESVKIDQEICQKHQQACLAEV
jgi:hypothetical protein